MDDARKTILLAVQKHIDTFLDEVCKDIAAIDVSELLSRCWKWLERTEGITDG